MTGQTITAAVVIGFSEQLEDGSAALYEEMAQRFPAYRDAFLGLARDCGKSKVTIVRTYQETITDAIEAGYSFEGMTMPQPLFGLALGPGQSLKEALGVCIALEDKASGFYATVAELSAALLATIPSAFRRVARTRAQRKGKLEAMGD
jgi:hypothetical protein